MREDEERKIVQDAINHRLSGLEEDPWLAQRIMAKEKGDQPKVKKKISVSLAVVLAIMMLTLSAALALTQSTILDELFGTEENAPQDVIDKIVTPEETASSALGKLSLDEVLYNGGRLHAVWTVTNPTDETLMYTMNGITLNGKNISMDNCSIFVEGAGSAGYILGGTLGGVEMPSSVTSYVQGTYLGSVDENGTYHMEPIADGKAMLKIGVAVWRPINEPEINNYKEYEGVDVDPNKASVHSLQVEESGYCNLWIFRPDQYWSGESTAEAYAGAYQELGWAEYVDSFEMEFEIDLNTDGMESVVPVQTEYALDDCTLMVSQFECNHAGGRCQLRITGDTKALEKWKVTDIYLVDPDAKRVLNESFMWYDQTADDSMDYNITINAITGELPERMYICTAIDYDDRWNEESYAYDPSIEKPEGVIGSQRFDFDNAICVELEKRN